MTDIPEFDPNSDDYEREVIETPAATTDRSVARRVALQILYEVDSTEHRVIQVLTSHFESEQESRMIREYATHLVRGVAKNYRHLDAIIQEYAPEWPLEQVAIVDRNVLRLALFEFGMELQTPVNVAIDEAVSLANVFGSEASPRFVNGVLGALSNNLAVVRERLQTAVNQQEEDD